MDGVSTETKVALIRQIRDKYRQDQYDLSRREYILYGQHNHNIGGSRNAYDYFGDREFDNRIDNRNPPVTGKRKNIRALIAGGIVSVILLCDLLHISPLGIPTREIFAMVATDYGEDLDVFLENYVASIDLQAP